MILHDIYGITVISAIANFTKSSVLENVGYTIYWLVPWVTSNVILTLLSSV